ncbi:peptidylprolyl isomerase [Plebeiibacterium sediminum]|uniref:peptidylprolyl isomerase n=1 Tax=Plebeiibacterium sediminum TaxID=2992112 RepID=A0AAE3M0W2_9BACT|nr:peptidylprolyl isomerase [Plebeiobacterium sediminum]MCW3785014.1 peptidylprolyl isomerase [Plebeiobacterium sediminum]
MRLLISIFFFLIILSIGCKTDSAKSNISKEEYSRPKGSYQSNIKGIVSIETYDHYTRIQDRGYGFYIGPKELVTNLDLIKGSYKVKVAPVGSEEFNDIAGYTAYSIEKNLVILKSWVENLNYIHLDGAITNIPDSVAGLYRKSKKIYAPKYDVREKVSSDSLEYYNLDRSGYSGIPAFTFMHHVVGMIQTNTIDKQESSILIPASEIVELSKKQQRQPTSVYELRTKTNKVYPSYKTIEGFKMITTMGDIEFKLYNETPVFRDNFIKLVSDQFYDSLLVHRVLTNFLIQTGAADSKYADKDDVVGWQGPGYMLKTVIAPEKFHKRGAIAMSKLPDSRNPKNLTDGSQFYIVSGRIFKDGELDKIEKEKGIKFSSVQRKVYTSLGGAPHLDGDYVVFGEVTKGMEVVDKIAALKTYGEDRPVNDVRVLKIQIIKK